MTKQGLFVLIQTLQFVCRAEIFIEIFARLIKKPNQAPLKWGYKYIIKELVLKTATQNGGQNHIGCKKYPGDKKQEALSQAYEAAKRMVADPVRFMKMVISQRSAPPTEVVAKNQQHHRFCFGYPLVIKPLDGRPLVLANNDKEAESATEQFKSVGYQVQKYLRGYTFIKVRVENGVIDSTQPNYVTGAVRRLVTLLLVQGVKNFTLTVATNKVTTYIIGAKLN